MIGMNMENLPEIKVSEAEIERRPEEHVEDEGNEEVTGDSSNERDSKASDHCVVKKSGQAVAVTSSEVVPDTATEDTSNDNASIKECDFSTKVPHDYKIETVDESSSCLLISEASNKNSIDVSRESVSTSRKPSLEGSSESTALETSVSSALGSTGEELFYEDLSKPGSERACRLLASDTVPKRAKSEADVGKGIHDKSKEALVIEKTKKRVTRKSLTSVSRDRVPSETTTCKVSTGSSFKNFKYGATGSTTAIPPEMRPVAISSNLDDGCEAPHKGTSLASDSSLMTRTRSQERLSSNLSTSSGTYINKLMTTLRLQM